MGGNQCFCGDGADLSTAAAKARSLASKAQCETKPCVGNPREAGCGGVGTMLAYTYTCEGVQDPADAGAEQQQHIDMDKVQMLRDGNGNDTTLIDTDKTCFSCFRIPTLLAGQSPGVVHAFAEGRRAELADVYHCPDGPDTHLVYKRSTDYGATWSPGTAFTQDPSKRVENGFCQSQASPVIDPVTKVLIVGYIDQGAGCLVRGTNFDTSQAKPTLVKSTDDGLTWSKPLPFMLNTGPGKVICTMAIFQYVYISFLSTIIISMCACLLTTQYMPTIHDSDDAVHASSS